jgi:hypothetical protein
MPAPQHLSITAALLAVRFPGIEADLRAVCGWLRVPTQECLNLILQNEPAARYRTGAREMEATYPEFPEEAARAAKIVALLQRGAPPWPLCVDDQDGFVMEGRHRVVAMIQLGHDPLPVLRIRRRESTP